MKYKVTIIALVTIMFAIGCTKDFETINTNPNSPISVNPDLILPQIQRDMMNALLNESWGIGNIVIQHTAKNQFVNEDRYLWGELNGIWNAVYDNLRDLNNILLFSEANGQNNVKAVGLIMRAWMISLVTDAYGDVPFSEAIKGKSDGIYYPIYDTQESIYNSILSDLKIASDLIGTTGESVGGDKIYGGNPDKWKKLANSLRVRYLMRISCKRDVSNELNEIFTNQAQYPLFTSNADNAVYTYAASNPDQYPNFTSRIGSFNEFRASKTLVDTLHKYNDPRVNIFFRPTPSSFGTDSAVVRGIPNGLDDVTAQTIYGGQQFHSQIGELFYEKAITPTGLTIAKGIIMTYSELQFLLAEAAVKNLISSNAEEHYQNGIRSSFEFYGLPASTDYFNQPEVAFTGSQTDLLRKIGVQKWISLYYSGLEAWFDWRRTGYPALLPSVDNQNNDMIPVRFIYPFIEQSINGVNRMEAVSRMGGDDLNTRMWILC